MTAAKDEPGNVLERLNRIQDEVDYVQKEKKQGMKYSIVSHDAVTAKVRPLMVKHGVLYYPHTFVMTQVGNRTQLTCLVRFVNIHDASDFIDVGTAGYGIDEQDKGPGKAISYAVKYALLKALGLESGDDPDSEQEVKHEDPSNPHNIAMLQFEADIDAADNTASLSAAHTKHAAAVAAALAEMPARAQQARQHYARKLRQLKDDAHGQ